MHLPLHLSANFLAIYHILILSLLKLADITTAFIKRGCYKDNFCLDRFLSLAKNSAERSLNLYYWAEITGQRTHKHLIYI